MSLMPHEEPFRIHACVQHPSCTELGCGVVWCVPCRPEADEDESDAEVDQKRLRMYERSKLRYYFAVVECDNVPTASNLYAQCDGLEFELTANRSDPAASAATVCFTLVPFLATPARPS